MKVSIVTTTYNSANTIADTFESVLRQSHKDLELIVVDGASVDGTLDIIKEYEPRFEGRMKWISEPDKGIYDAMNKGIRLATGELVGILNSDDYYTSDDVLDIVTSTFAEKEEKGEHLDAVYADVHYVTPTNPDKCVRYYSSAIFRTSRLKWGYMPAHPSFYCRKEVYDRCGLYSLDYKIASDFDMMVRMFHTHKIKAQYIPRDFVTMRTGGISTKNIRNRLRTTHEDVKACRVNGVYTNIVMVSVKYFTKIFEFKS